MMLSNHNIYHTGILGMAVFPVMPASVKLTVTECTVSILSSLFISILGLKLY